MAILADYKKVLEDLKLVSGISFLGWRWDVLPTRPVFEICEKPEFVIVIQGDKTNHKIQERIRCSKSWKKQRIEQVEFYHHKETGWYAIIKPYSTILTMNYYFALITDAKWLTKRIQEKKGERNGE